MKFLPIFLVGLVLSFSASASPVGANEQSRSLQERRALSEDVALALAPVKSKRDLYQYMQNTPEEVSPLEKLSPEAKDRFVSSLTFNENGITGFQYSDLENELTASEAYQLLSLFGAQHTVRMLSRIRVETPIDAALALDRHEGGPLCPSQPCDYEDMECEKHATCAPSLMRICMRNC